MSEHGSRRAGGGGGSRGRRSANGGGFSDKLDGLTNQLSGMFGKRGGGRRGGDGYDDQYDEYGSYDDRGYENSGYGDSHHDGYGDEAEVASGGGRRGAGRRASAGSGGTGGTGGTGRGRGGRGGRNGGYGPDDLPPKDWWMKFINYPRYGKRGWRHWMPSIKQVLSVFLGFLFTVIGVVAYAYANTQIPQVKNSIAAGNPTTYTYDDGEVFADIGVHYYQVNDINQIPKAFQDAFVAAENYSFWTDPGVSFTGVARSALNDLFGSGGKQGGSTITQEYVKNAYLSQDQTLSRKINEVMIAIKLNHQESKQQILLGYLNQISFGRGAYGIDAASRAYFGKPISQMTNANIGEAAFLASVINDPSNFSTALVNDKSRKDNPKTFERFLKRYNAVLANMSQYGFEPKAATDPLQNKLPTVQDFKGPNLSGWVGYMKDSATQYLQAQLQEYPDDPQTQKFANIDNLSKGGYKIVTTYNHVMMADSKTAADALWTGTSGGGGGKWNPKTHASDHDVHLAFASVDPHNGELKSFYTGTDGVEDYSQNAFNYAVQGGVQVGSTFKPITLATALQSGKFSLDSTEEGSNVKPLFYPPGNPQPLTYTDSHGNTKLYPPNEDDEVGGFNGNATLKQGLAMSLNSVFAALELDPSVGVPAVYNMAEALGIKPETPDFKMVASLTLGTAEITPMRMANAYGAFDNGGVSHEPVQVTAIIDQRTGQTVWTPKSMRKDTGINKQVMSANTAAGVTAALQGVLQKGGTAGANTDAAALMSAANGNLAGKTGTTDFNHSAWFTGFSSSLATSVAVFRSTPDGALESIKGLGYDDQSTRINGMDWPTTVWSKFMSIELNKDKTNFAKPFAPYAPICSGVSNIVSFGQSVSAGPLATDTNSLPGTPTGSEANCQAVFVPTPSPTPTPTPTKATTSSAPPLCQSPASYDPASQQCVTLPSTPTDTSSQQQPSGTGTSNTTGPTSPTSTTPTTPSSRFCQQHPTDPQCPTTSTPTSSSSSSNLFGG
ncbi:membrane peptidoglycan carboxypeptidase [Catenulispora sp. GAS73]|uniref:transglycosylase domain-containing protein n=1 Tax=Catenulispora sp. GAS73 TaxID=3156269 RepID=UPI0035118811